MMTSISTEFRDAGFWSVTNSRWGSVHFRLEKCARIVNRLAAGRPCDLVDVGCGPSALLSLLLSPNITYSGIDIAPRVQSASVIQADLAKTKIAFGDRRFDIAVSAGIFEYLGGLQEQKLQEIAAILRPGGKLIATYTNFHHINDKLIDHSIYNNVEPLSSFRRALDKSFRVERWFPSSHNWHCSEPRRPFMKRVQMPLQKRIPFASKRLAVAYFFICSLRSE